MAGDLAGRWQRQLTAWEQADLRQGQPMVRKLEQAEHWQERPTAWHTGLEMAGELLGCSREELGDSRETWKSGMTGSGGTGSGTGFKLTFHLKEATSQANSGEVNLK